MTRFIARSPLFLALALAASVFAAAGCHSNPKPATPEAPAPSPFPGAVEPSPSTAPLPAPPPPTGLTPDAPISSAPLLPWNGRSLDEINGANSPLKPILFAYDSDDLDDAARKAVAANAEMLKTYTTWVVTVEGHCDERGTAEYNLALGDRRALAVRGLLVSLGISADRVRTVSYGKEFPFDTGHTEAAWAQNRRAQFMLTSK